MRAFSVAVSVPTAALLRAQAIVALLAQPPTDRTHPLRRILDALDAAEVQRQTEGVLRGGSGARAREVLCTALGPTEGAALYRDWIDGPREHLRNVVAALSEAVAAALPDRSGTGFDTHVRLHPSGPVVATIFVRSRAILTRLAADDSAVEAQLMSVSAPGQTVRSALDFWEAVSYADQPPLGLRGYPPLGMGGGYKRERANVVGEAVLLGSWQSVSVQVSRRLPRRTRATSALLTAAREAVERGGVNGDASGACPPLWTQPDVLLSSVRPGVTGKEARRPKTQALSPPLPVVPQSRDALVAVYYVTMQGMAYRGHLDAERLPDAPLAPCSNANKDTVVPVAAKVPASQQTPPWWLSLDSQESFTRGLLGL